MGLTIVGAGNMGSALVRALTNAGYDVTVWNRTEEKLAPLRALGVEIAKSPKDAIERSDCLILSLANYDVTYEILTPLGTDLARKDVIQLTTGKPRDARNLAVLIGKAGGRYLDGAVMGFPNHVGTNANTVLYSGDESVVETWRGELEAIGNVHFFGNDPGAASAFDIACLMPIVAMTVGLMQGIKVCKTEGIDADRYDSFMREWLPLILEDSLVKSRKEGFAADLESAECTIGLMSSITEMFAGYCAESDLDPRLFAALADLFGEGVERGLSSHDWINAADVRELNF